MIEDSYQKNEPNLKSMYKIFRVLKVGISKPRKFLYV